MTALATDAGIWRTDERAVTPDAVPEPQLRSFHEYWCSLAPKAGWPRRSDFDPVAIPRLLAYMLLTEWCSDGGIRVRLTGTHLVERIGSDPTGDRAEDHAGDAAFGDFTIGVHDVIARTRSPVYVVGRHVHEYATRQHCCRIAAPLSSDGQTLDMVVHCVVFHAERAAHPIVDGGVVRPVQITPVRDAELAEAS